LADTPLLRRKEARIPVKMFVNLYNLDNPSFELAPTIDISCHGARVITKRIWRPNQKLSVRSIRGDYYSRGRVVRCEPQTDNSFVIGIEMYYPMGDWTKSADRTRSANGFPPRKSEGAPGYCKIGNIVSAVPRLERSPGPALR
jgi:hypothetical protein